MYLGAGDHYSHMRSGILDLHDNKSPVKNKDGVYSMNLFAVWNNTRFLFIYLFFVLFISPTWSFEEEKCNSFYLKKSSGNYAVEPKTLRNFSNNDGNGKENRRYSRCGLANQQLYTCMLQRTGVRYKEFIHVIDWYPTLLHLAGLPAFIVTNTLYV